MEEAIGRLFPRPELVLVDGRGLPDVPVARQALVGGDRCCGSIAAASIVAKVVRDRLMMELDVRHPGYGFARHKGYATREHLARLGDLGPCPEHRMTFAPLRALQQGCLPLTQIEDPP
jgi:ribonuclease HII